jgi:hypothetical protein
MSSRIDPRLVALCGSETRAKTVGVLAGAFRPLTGYRVGRTAGISLPKVYRELKRLEVAGLARHSPQGWSLIDPDVAALFRRRYRVSWADDWFAEIRRRSRDDAALLRKLRTLPPPAFPRAWTPRRPERFRRSPGKDQLLKELGWRESHHGDAD